jgi:hypothetical protein
MARVRFRQAGGVEVEDTTNFWFSIVLTRVHVAISTPLSKKNPN